MLIVFIKVFIIIGIIILRKCFDYLYTVVLFNTYKVYHVGFEQNNSVYTVVE